MCMHNGSFRQLVRGPTLLLCQNCEFVFLNIVCHHGIANNISNLYGYLISQIEHRGQQAGGEERTSGDLGVVGVPAVEAPEACPRCLVC
jgi:hypothetical protein